MTNYSYELLVEKINKSVKNNFITSGCGKKFCDGEYGIDNIIRHRTGGWWVSVVTYCLTCFQVVPFVNKTEYKKVKSLPNDWKKAMAFFEKTRQGFLIATPPFEMQQYKFEDFHVKVDIEYHVEEEIEGYSREPISQDTQDRVWRRDEGKCVQCGSNEDIEYDHIIPVSRGGKSTYRNLQLLCESCNRSKGSK